MEDIWVEIKTGNANFILSTIYRHQMEMLNISLMT